jgi:predicted DNA-binding transcriptional regulator AlpA
MQPVRLLSPSHAAQALDVSVATVRRLMRQYRRSGGTSGLGPVFCLGHSCVRIPESAVSAWLASRELTTIEREPAQLRAAR